MSKCLLGANQGVNCDEGIGMERCRPKPKTAIGGRQAKIFETQVLVARFRLPCERVADDRRKDILDLCSVFPVLCLFRKITLFFLSFLFAFFLGLGLLVISDYRFRKISLRSLSLKSFEAFKWEKVFNRTLLESEKATQTFCKSFKPD